jgi:tape measure domain-containing protein
MALRDLFVKMGIEIDQTPLRETQKGVNALVIQLNQLQRIAGFALAAFGVGTIIQAADEYTNLTNRLRAVTKSTEEFESAQRGVFDVARATITPVEDVAALFQRFTLVTDHLGKSQGEVLDFTQQLTMAMKLGGSTAAEARGALIQFGQGLGNNFKSGGQELNSIMEQAPELAKILADAAGGTVAELKTLARDGKLTTDVIFEAMKKAQPELERRFIQRAKSFEDVKVAFGIEWLAFMKQLEPLFAKVTRAMLDIVTATKEWIDRGEALNTMIAAAIVIFGALTVAMAPLLIKLLLVAAAFGSIYLVVQDFVTFIRGGDSLIGRFFESVFGENGAEKARFAFLDFWDTIKAFFAFLVDPSAGTWQKFYESAALWLGKIKNLVNTMMTDLVTSLGEALNANSVIGPLLRLVNKFAGESQANNETGPEMQSEMDGAMLLASGATPRDVALMGKTLDPTLQNQAYLSEQPSLITDGKNLVKEFGGWLSGGAEGLADWLTPTPEEYRVKPDMAPSMFRGTPANVTNNITNQITVQGSATAETSRDIAAQTGAATVDAVGGRDNAAVGASFGVAQ